MPGADFVTDGTNIRFTVAPRTRLPADDEANTYITFLNGFSEDTIIDLDSICLLYTSPSPRDATLSRMPSSA